MDLILGACAGYPAAQIRHFAESLRRWYSGDVVLVTGYLPADTKALLRQFNIQQVEAEFSLPLSNIQVLRFMAYREILNARPQVDRVFLLDVRDMFFQANPFSMLPNAPLVAYLEEETLGNCGINRGWLEALYGPQRVAELSPRTVSCSGTTAGTRPGMLRYLELMCREIASAATRPLPPGWDQGVHNHLVHGELSDTVLVPNRTGAVQTLVHQKTFLFDRQGRTLNIDGSICPVLHQIDRFPQFLGLWGIPHAAVLG